MELYLEKPTCCKAYGSSWKSEGTCSNDQQKSVTTKSDKLFFVSGTNKHPGKFTSR